MSQTLQPDDESSNKLRWLGLFLCNAPLLVNTDLPMFSSMIETFMRCSFPKASCAKAFSFHLSPPA